jgi:hypothetical protein
MEIDRPLDFGEPRTVSFGSYGRSLLDLFMTSKTNSAHCGVVDIKL